MPARDTESVDRTTAPTHQQPLHRQESSAPNLGSNVREAGTLEGNHPDVTRDIQNTNSATQQQLRSRIRDLRQAAYDTQSEALRILSELLPIQERHGLTWELQRNIRALDRNIHDFQQALLQLFPPLSGDARHSSGRTGVMNQQPTEHGTLFNSAQLDTQSRPQARAEPHNQPFNPGLSWSHRQTYPNAPPLSAASNQNQNAIEESEAQAEVVRAREDYHRMISESPVMTDEEYRIFEHARGRIRRAERRLFRARNDQRRAGVLGTREDVQSEGFTSDITTMFSRYREQYQMREATRNSQNSQHGVTDGAQGFSSPDGSASSALSDTQLMGLGALMARNASPAAQTQSGGYNMHARSFETPAETGAHSFDGPGPGQSVQRLFAEHNATNSGTSSVLGSQSPHEHEPHWQRPSPHNVDVHTSSNRTSPFPQNNQGSHGNGNESAIYSYSDLSSRFDAPDPHISFAHSRSRRAELYGAHSSPQQYSFVHGPIAGPPGLIQQHPLPASQGPGGSNQGHQPGPSRRAPANLTRMARSDMSDMIIEQIRLEAMNGSLPPEFGGGHALGRDRRRTAVPEDPNVPVGLDRLGTDRPSTEITEDNKWMRMECKICYSQIANVVLLPCGKEIILTALHDSALQSVCHCVMCRWCADEAYASHSADATIIMDRTKKCPVCRSKARSKHMIYGPEQEGKRKAKGKNKEREKKDEENQGDPDGHGDEGGSSNGAAPMAA
ncbi:MAG: hypothetical protein MMC23_007194 [Stictis urceolatum]|nr:hypothetical protein [Stictis urceolata]